jgi:hypothetical protein
VKDPSRIQITASTGVAALNIGGTTLHSFAGKHYSYELISQNRLHIMFLGIGVAKLPIRDLLARIKASRATHHRWLTTEILVIDESELAIHSYSALIYLLCY